MHNLFKILFLTVLGTAQLLCEPFTEFKGTTDWHKTAHPLDVVSTFLPYNPVILTLGFSSKNTQECATRFPLATILSTHTDASKEIDFIWSIGPQSENYLYKQNHKQLSQARLIFVETHFLANSDKDYSVLKEFLHKMGFVPTAHWYDKKTGGQAIFLQKDFFDIVQKSKIYPATEKYRAPFYQNPTPLKQFLKNASSKGKHHSYPPIDFIYMINADENPEKFSKAYHNLALHHIHPYRFSAINGWKLQTEVLNQIGVRFSSDLPTEKFLGRVYRKHDSKEYVSHEFMTKADTSYFSSEKMTKGAIGHVLSHLSVLQDAFDSGYKIVWVLEDTVEVLSDPAQLKVLIRQLQEFDKNWDILFTDIDFRDKEGKHIPCKELAIRPNYSLNPSLYRVQDSKSASKKGSKKQNPFTRCSMRYGSYSMIIKRSGIEKILEYYNTYSIFLPYDLDFYLDPTIRMYRPTQDIVSKFPDSDSNYTLEPNE